MQPQFGEDVAVDEGVGLRLLPHEAGPGRDEGERDDGLLVEVTHDYGSLAVA